MDDLVALGYAYFRLAEIGFAVLVRCQMKCDGGCMP